MRNVYIYVYICIYIYIYIVFNHPLNLLICNFVLGSKFRGSPFLACGFNASEVFSCQPHQCCWDLAARAKGGVRRSIQRKAAGCSNVRGCGGSCSKEKLATYPSATNRVCKVWSALFWCPNPTAFFWGCYLCDRGPPAEPNPSIQETDRCEVLWSEPPGSVNGMVNGG